MKRVFHKAKDKKEAEKWDIKQQIFMSPDERLTIVDELKKRFYGKNVKDVRETVEK